jgi:hypothetical protein
MKTIIGKSKFVPNRVYILVKEVEGYIFREALNPVYGFNGHFPTEKEAIDNFKSISKGKIVSI